MQQPITGNSSTSKQILLSALIILLYEHNDIRLHIWWLERTPATSPSIGLDVSGVDDSILNKGFSLFNPCVQMPVML